MAILKKRRSLCLVPISESEVVAFGRPGELEVLGDEAAVVPAVFTQTITTVMEGTKEFRQISDQVSGRVLRLKPESAELLRRHDLMRTDGAVLGTAVERNGKIVGPLKFEPPGIELANVASLASTIAMQQQLVAIEKKLDAIKTDLDYLIDSQHAEVEARMRSAVHVLDDVYAEVMEQGRFDDDQWDRIAPLEQVVRELHERCLVHLRTLNRAMAHPTGHVGARVKVLEKAVRDAHLDVWLPMYFHAERSLTQWEVLWVLRQVETQPERAHQFSSDVRRAVNERHQEMVALAHDIAGFLDAHGQPIGGIDRIRLLSQRRLRHLLSDLDQIQEQFRESLLPLELKVNKPKELPPARWDELAAALRTGPARVVGGTSDLVGRGFESVRARLPLSRDGGEVGGEDQELFDS